MASAPIEIASPAHTSIARPPSSGELLTDRLVHWGTTALAWAVIALGTYIVLQISWTARPAR